MGDPSTYFATINELEGEKVDELRSLLIAVGEDCTKLEKKCSAGDALFALVSRGFNMASQPIHLVYIDEDNQVRTNVLLHHHRVTPYMYGQRNVWVAVFAENPLDLKVELTTLWRQKRSSLSSLDLGLALGATLRTEPVDDLVLEGVNVGEANLNLYLMVDIYIIKPTVLSPMVQSFWGRYRPSIGIALGTNLRFWDAQEINVGVSLGHLVGRHGLVFGVNIINSTPNPEVPTGAENSDDRLIRPYIAGLFKF